VGKPSPLMIDYIVYKYKIPKEKICMVGDRLDTDILFGKVRASQGRGGNRQLLDLGVYVDLAG
jgi:FMN phosphatase YigB (HAD superfamily)